MVNLNNDHGKGPILVIFSRKSETLTEVPHRREERDTLKKRGHRFLLEENLQLGNKANDFNNSNASSGAHYFQGLVEFISATSRSKKKRVSCQRNEMYVDFETIKWDKVIIFPRGYQAFECVGKCYTPMSEYLTPTKHAIIQTLVHTSYPDQASRACCVPTKLDPISILYWDDNGDIKYDYTYEGMVVAECGCR
ncbi:unnamed protein product [Candidula unifasciata]|uniref:TGF-beta family profile domain-containing protein n=1 Tax=Candidula unifasciata TaxID=100452 RepID=A0A8S3YZU0_9EUPU|nr:unnamed protein product [Candidula unifasciata]